MAESNKASVWIRVGSWVVAILYVGVFYWMACVSSAMGVVYHVLKAPKPWGEQILSGLTPPIGLMLGLVLAAILVVQAYKLDPSDCKRWNVRAARILAMLAAFRLVVLLIGAHAIVGLR